MRSAAGGAALLAAGMAAAVLCTQALGQVGVPVLTVSLPTVTVTTPTLPVPTPPAPPPPSVPSTPAAPPLPAPAVPVSASAPPVRAPSTTGQAGSGSAPVELPSPGGTSTTWYTASERERGPAGTSGPKSRARVSRLNASPKRFKAGSKRRGTRITFRLTAPARVVFLVRGPAPSCEVVGRFFVRGRRGVNRVRFKGRVGRRTLSPGTYALTARPAGKPEPRRRVVVIIGSAPRRELDCSASTGLSYLGAGGNGESGSSAGTVGSATSAAITGRRETKKRDRGVLPAIRRKIGELPAIPIPSIPREPADAPPAILGLLLLGLLALSGVAIVGYVIRSARGAYTKSA